MPVDRETYTRLFIMGGKGLCKEDYRQAFSKFGTVTDIFLTKDRNSKEFNGNVYLTYATGSDAVHALEEMNGKTVGDHPKQLKVLLAAPKGEWAVLGHREAFKLQRLFIVVPQSYTDDDILEKFKQFGPIEFARVIKNKTTGTSKGLAFVKYYRAYHAALALEGCDQTFKPVYASNRQERLPLEGDRRFPSNNSISGGPSGGGFMSQQSHQSNGRSYQASNSYAMDMTSQQGQGQGQGQCRLEVMAPNMVSAEQLRRVFDIVPGLQSCDLDNITGITYVCYQSAQLASHALDKLDGFEYPPGYRISVKYPGLGCGSSQQAFSNDRQPMGSNPLTDNLSTLVDSIQKATAVLQQAGIANPFNNSSMSQSIPNTSQSSQYNSEGESLMRVDYTHVMLPDRKPLMPRDTIPQRRLFIVATTHCFENSILEDAFCRFGCLISASFIPGKTFAFAKYSDSNCAQRAMDTLHKQQICGVMIKVLEGEPRKSEMHDEMDSDDRVPRKRAHHDDEIN